MPTVRPTASHTMRTMFLSSIVVLMCPGFVRSDCQKVFRRGDSNEDATLDLSDSIFTLTWLFLGGPPPGCLDAADSNDDGATDIADAVFALGFLVLGGPVPPAPGPFECGPDPTNDPLDCGRYRPCPIEDCSCTTNAECPRGSYCAKEEGDCDGKGECRERPEACPDVWDPVCGCDGQTYGNDCEAAAAGVNVARRGECTARCGGIAGIPCEEGLYCDLPAGLCEGVDLMGECVTIPEACPRIWDPVCGCDGETYANDCERIRAGVQKDHDGECKVSCTTNAECPPGSYCAKEAGDCDGQGECRERPVACPEIFDPVCGCDGVTYSNSCFAAAAGVNVAFDGECDTSCTTNAECPRGSYCAKEEGDCDGKGECRERPEACPDVWDPVCGCDGQTYGNDCEAAAAGVNVARRGECTARCGGIAGIPCEEGLYCDLPAGLCEGVDLMGECVTIPEACPRIWEPVCGCDGETYANDCERIRAGVQKDHDGPCRKVCGGFVGLPCDEGEYCDLPEGECQGADLQGECVPVSEFCPALWDPVCGCDGQTYGNDCERIRAGVQKAADGECPPR